MSAPVLIIENHPAHRAAIETALRGLPFEVESADSGGGALMRLGMADYGCIVIGSPVDVDFGGESSTMLQTFDRLAPALASRLIVITDPRSVPVIRRAVHMKVFAVFLAPFDGTELRGAVQQCLGAEAPSRRLHGASDDVAALLAEDIGGSTW